MKAKTDLGLDHIVFHMSFLYDHMSFYSVYPRGSTIAEVAKWGKFDKHFWLLQQWFDPPRWGRLTSIYFTIET